MSSNAGIHAFVAAPDEGERLGMAGLLKVSTTQTGGAFEVFELDAPRGPLPHVHHDREECFYIIEGLFTFVLGREEVEVPAGSVVFVPRGTRHGFKPGQGARALVFSIPGGLLEGFFRELLEGLGAGRPEAELRAELAGKYDSWPAE
jgi:mannose-6-phosphate isomerase-like protein (cupin superfamily)